MATPLSFVNKLLENDLPPDPHEVDPQHYIDQAAIEASRPLDDFTRGYITCMLWSTNDEDEEPLDKNYDVDSLSPAFLRRIKADCANFQKENADNLAHAVSARPSEWSAMEHAGHDFWLTRNGHGAGFWDDPQLYGGREIADRLTDAAHAYGSVDVYTVVDQDECPGDVVIHAMQEAVPKDFDPAQYIDQLAPERVREEREKAELEKRGFRYWDCDGTPPVPAQWWKAGPPENTFIAKYLLGNLWRLSWYGPHGDAHDTVSLRGTFDEMMAEYDRLSKLGVVEAMDPDNPDILGELRPFLELGKQVKSGGTVNDLFRVHRTSDGKQVGTLYRANLGQWGWFDLRSDYFGFPTERDFKMHNFRTAEQALHAASVWLHGKGALRPGTKPPPVGEAEEDPLGGISPEHYIDWVGKKIDLGSLTDLHLGFAIQTSDQVMIEENARERQIELNDQIWAIINKDIERIERNAVNLLGKWFTLTTEGHTDNAFVGSMWLNNREDNPVLNREGLILLKDWAESSEPPRTSSGTLDAYFGRGSQEQLYKGTSQYGESLIDVDIELLDRDKVNEWFEVNGLTNMQEALDDVDPEYYINKITASYCRDCMADLTQPYSVIRSYYAKDEGAGDVSVMGHYQDGYFEPDSSPSGPLDRHDLANDSDSCAKCESKNLHESEEPDIDREAERYIDSFEDVRKFKDDATNFGFFFNYIDVWGKWVIFRGGIYWAVVDERPITEEDIRSLMDQFLRKHHVFDHKFQLARHSIGHHAGGESFGFKANLAVPKHVFTDASIMAASASTFGTPAVHRGEPEVPIEHLLREDDIDDPEHFIGNFEPHYFVVSVAGGEGTGNPVWFGPKAYWVGHGEGWTSNPLDAAIFNVEAAKEEYDYLVKNYDDSRPDLIGTGYGKKRVAMELVDKATLEKYRKKRETYARRKAKRQRKLD
jgi:hypothetical protein